jgi:hypothetical protein
MASQVGADKRTLLRCLTMLEHGESVEDPAAVSPVRCWLLKLSEVWRQRRPAMALWAALLTGGAAVWFLRIKGEGVSVEASVVSVELRQTTALVSDSEEPFDTPIWLPEVLRKDPEGSTTEDRRLLWEFLRKCCGVENGGRNPDWFEADEVLCWLRGAYEAASEVESELVNLGGNPSLLGSIRCLALNHLGRMSEERVLGVETVAQLRSATGERLARGVGAAALRVLHRMRSSSGDREWLRARVLELLEDADCPPEQRVAALEVAVELDAGEVESIARKLVDPRRQAAERVSAFVALGRLGNGETLRWLRAQPLPVEALVLEARERAVLNLTK